MEQLEMNHTIHETRHTTATMLSNVKPPIDELTIKYIMRHKTDVDVTQRYQHRRIEQLIEAIDKI